MRGDATRRERRRAGLRGRTLSAAALLGLLLAGCGGDAPPPEIAVVDSAGVRIVTNPSFDPPAWPVGAPTLELGTVEGEGPEQFYRVAGAAWLERDGRRLLALANAGSGEIRLFDEAGTWVESWGRQGEGPGEFGAVGPIWRLPGDSLLVWDGRLERMTVLGPDGAYVRQFRRPPVLNAEPAGRFGDGSILFSGAQFVIGDDVRPMDLALSRVDADGSVDTLPTETYGEFGPVGPEGRTMIAQPIFGSITVVVADGDGYWVVPGTDPQVRRHAPDGELRTIARWRLGDRSVSGEAAARFRERALEGLEGEAREIRRMQLADRPVAEEFATTGYAFSGHAGELWVAPPDWPPNDSTTEWRVIDPEGRLAGRVTLPKFPDRFIPLLVGPDHVVGNARSELGVEYVRVYPITRATGERPSD